MLKITTNSPLTSARLSCAVTEHFGEAMRTFVDQNLHCHERLLPARAVDGAKGSLTNRPLNRQLIPLQLPHVRLWRQGLRWRIVAAAAAAVAAATVAAFAQVRFACLGGGQQGRVGGQVGGNVEEQRVRGVSRTAEGRLKQGWHVETGEACTEQRQRHLYLQDHTCPYVGQGVPSLLHNPSAHLAAFAALLLLPAECAPVCAAAGCEVLDGSVRNESSSSLTGAGRPSLPSAANRSWQLPFMPPSGSTWCDAERRLRSQPLRGRNARSASTATAGWGGGKQGNGLVGTRAAEPGSLI